MVTKEQFLEDVMHEINALKEHATKDELSSLNMGIFNPISKKQCIYGLMTGSCDTVRAKELMDKSCVRAMDFEKTAELRLGLTDIPEDLLLQAVNGEYTGKTWGTKSEYDLEYHRTYYYISALEGYILMHGAKNKEVLAYLRGEQETLEL